MKKIILTALCLAMGNVYACNSSTCWHVSPQNTNTYMSFLQDSLHFCYPPNDQQHSFPYYYSSTSCYYRNNNDCSQAQVVQFDTSASPNQIQNQRFFTLCNTTDTAQQAGPQFLLYPDENSTTGNIQIDACILPGSPLPYPINNPPPLTTSNLCLFWDNTQTPAMTSGGCLSNEYGVLDLQPATGTYKITCYPINTPGVNGTVRTATNLPTLLANHYTMCPLELPPSSACLGQLSKNHNITRKI